MSRKRDRLERFKVFLFWAVAILVCLAMFAHASYESARADCERAGGTPFVAHEPDGVGALFKTGAIVTCFVPQQ